MERQRICTLPIIKMDLISFFFKPVCKVYLKRLKENAAIFQKARTEPGGKHTELLKLAVRKGCPAQIATPRLQLGQPI